MKSLSIRSCERFGVACEPSGSYHRRIWLVDCFHRPAFGALVLSCSERWGDLGVPIMAAQSAFLFFHQHGDHGEDAR